MSVAKGIWLKIRKILTLDAFMGLNFGFMTILAVMAIRESSSQPVGLWVLLFLFGGMTVFEAGKVLEDWRRPDGQP